MACLICKSNNDPLISLKNETVVHENCLQFNYNKEKDEARAETNKLNQIKNSLKPNFSFLDYIFGNKQEEMRIENEKRALQAKMNELERQISEYRSKEEKFLSDFSEVIAECVKFWPSYPPTHFWNELRFQAIERAKGRCVDCKKRIYGSGHVHHRHPLSMGGLNEISNLVFLCEQCHRDRHPHPFGQGKPGKGKQKKKYSDLSIKEKLHLALSMNQKIWIKYSDNQDEVTERWIKIDKFFTEKDRSGREWIEAYCYLRDDTRTFRIDRIFEASIKKRDNHDDIDFDVV